MWAIRQVAADGTLINTWVGPGTDALVDSRIPVMWERLRDNIGAARFDAAIAQGVRFFLDAYPTAGSPPVEILPQVETYHGPPITVGDESIPWWVLAGGAFVLFKLLR